MLPAKERFAIFMATIPVLLLMVLLNTLISMFMGVMAFTLLGWSKAASTAIGAGTYVYLLLLPKIRRYIDVRSKRENE